MFKLYKDKINISKDISNLNSQINVLKDNEFQKNNDLSYDDRNTTKDDALKISEELYEDMYDKIIENSFWIYEEEKITIPNMDGEFSKVKLENLKKYFSKNFIDRIKAYLVEFNGEYYYQRNHEYKRDIVISILTSCGMFGHTSPGPKPISILDYTNDMIALMFEIREFGYNSYTILVKEDNKWVIEYLEFDDVFEEMKYMEISD